MPCSLNRTFALSACDCFDYAVTAALRGGWVDDEFRFTLHAFGMHIYIDFTAKFAGDKLELHAKSDAIGWDATDIVIEGIAQ